MERFQQRRSKSYQENVQSWRRVDNSKLASDSRSGSSHLDEEDSFPFELRRGRLNQTAEASIKKLLAEEMETRRRPPSVIAKLMGLDSLPTPQPIKKQPKQFSENYRQRTASIGSVEKSSSYEGRSLRMTNKEQQEFKDVFEVSEPTKGVSYPPHPGHITVLKSSHANGIVSSRSDRKVQRNRVDDFMQESEVSITSHARYKHGVQSLPKIPNSQSGEKDETRAVPTRIVVLKPNLRKAQNKARPVSSSGSLGGHQSGYKESRDFQSSEDLELFAEVRNRRSSPLELEVLKHRNRGSREIAKEITRQMRHSVNSRRLSSSRLRGYAGDESSDTVSGNDSANESELMTPTFRHFNDWKNRYIPSSSYSTESSVSREAKKRLSERWKMTHRFQEVGKVGRGSTLGEMLAMPDRETRLATLDSMATEDGFTDILARNGVATRWASPLGISSRDGWKDECARTLARSRSLPSSSTTFGSPKINVGHGVHGSDRFSMQKEAVNRVSRRSKTEDFEQTLDFFSKGSSTRSRGKKSQSLSFVGKEKSHSRHEAHLRAVEPSLIFEEEDLSDKRPRSLELTDYDVEDTIHVWDETDVPKPWDKMIPCESSQGQPSEEISCITSANAGETSSHNSDHTPSEVTEIGPKEVTSCLPHSSVTEVESHPNGKEAGLQPSPVSVLEPQSSVEESVSGSDSFETVSADLHGLRMQLQLLKMESSDAYSEGFEMMVSSDEDNEDKCVGLKENEVSRDFSYLVDVLVDLGIHDADMDLFLTRYSPEGVVGIDVFERLEKKFEEETTWPKFERRLLFDRIESGLMDLLQSQMDPHPWVKRGKQIKRRWVGPLAEELWSLLVNDENEENEDLVEREIGKAKWLDLGDSMDDVGREIERFLFDKLLTEVW